MEAESPRIWMVSFWYTFWNPCWNLYHQPSTSFMQWNHISAWKLNWKDEDNLTLVMAVCNMLLSVHIWSDIRIGSKINWNVRKIFQAKIRFYGWKIGSFLLKKHIVFEWRERQRESEKWMILSCAVMICVCIVLCMWNLKSFKNWLHHRALTVARQQQQQNKLWLKIKSISFSFHLKLEISGVENQLIREHASHIHI